MHFWDTFSQLLGAKVAGNADMFLAHTRERTSSLLSACNECLQHPCSFPASPRVRLANPTAHVTCMLYYCCKTGSLLVFMSFSHLEKQSLPPHQACLVLPID